MFNIPHIPVLYREVIEAFEDIDSGIIIDCTMGYAGHSSMILEANPNIKALFKSESNNKTSFFFCYKRDYKRVWCRRD